MKKYNLFHIVLIGAIIGSLIMFIESSNNPTYRAVTSLAGVIIFTLTLYKLKNR